MTTTNGTHAVRLPPSAHLDKLPEQHFYDLGSPAGDRETTLRDLLQSDHGTIAPLRNPNLILHSHMPHILGSALGLGLGSDFLKEAHDSVVKSLIEIDSSFVRGEKIEKAKFREYLGQKQYTVAWVDFFDQEFEQANGDWRKVTEEYLFAKDKMLMNGLDGGLGHPVIHLAYAYELGCKETAADALSLACTEFSGFNQMVDHPQPEAASYRTKFLGEVLDRVRQDTRFDGIAEFPGITNMGALMQKGAGAVMEHWNAWDIDDPLQQLEQICDFSIVLALTTCDSVKEFDFYILHVMTVAHGLRVLWHLFPPDRQAPMLREFGVFAITQFICQQRPAFDIEDIEAVDVKGRDWEWVRSTAANHQAKFDVHFFKAVRAPIAFKDTFGEKDGFYLKAAIKFLDEYRGWTGFGKGLGDFDPRTEQWYPEH